MAVPPKYIPVNSVSPPAFALRQLAIGSQATHKIVLDSNSYAWAWGLATSGQLGNNNAVFNQSSPVSVVGGKQWLSIVGGSSFTVGLDSSSYPWAWGIGTTGQLGNNAVAPASSPVSVVGGRQFRSIAAGMGLDSNSYAWAWGIGNSGQLGNGT